MNRRILPIAIACLSLSGCGTILEGITGGDADNSVSAVPIMIDPGLRDVAQNGTDEAKREFLGSVVIQSEQNCNKFLNNLILGENTLNTSGDVVETVLSALSTAFVPPGTKTALSAGATIVSGSKTAVDADLCDKAAASDFAKAIDQTYWTNIQSYTSVLPKLASTTDTPLVLTNEIAKIESYHAMCALGPAESSIQAKLASPPAPASPLPANSQQPLVGAAPRLGQQPAPPSTPPVTQAAVPGTAF